MSSVKSLTLRLMTVADLNFANALREVIGWNQTPNDWRRLLTHEPDGCFVAEWNGSPAGTATTTCYGTELAWIGMVLVHPHYRRRGIGKALLDRCLTFLSGRRVRCIKLDATPLGKPLYEQLGFREEWPLTRWQINLINAPSLSDVLAPEPSVRAWRSSDAAQVAEFDRTIFGVSRERMLESLARESCRALIHTSANGQITGHGMQREGSKASYLGPVVASAVEAGTALINALLLQTRTQTIYWDIPDSNLAATFLAKQRGFTPQRSLLRMFLGSNETPGQPGCCFGIADPAMG